MSKLELQVLGELEIVRDGEVLPLPPSKKTRALIAYLALTGRAHRRERLCSLLWDVADDPRGALRWSLSKIRALVDAPGMRRLVADRESVAFEAQGAVVDLFAARAVVDRIDDASTEELEETARRFRGELLEGMDLADFDDFQAWLVAEREQARRLRARIARALVERCAGRPEVAIPHARTLARVDPLDEGARLGLVRLLADAGRLPEARQQLGAAKRTLREVGRTPSLAFTEVERSLAGRRPPPAEAAAPAEPPPPPPRRSPIMRSTVHGLRMVGRSRELEHLSSVLDAAAAEGRLRVVLISGEPGVGKSRVLVELMTEARKRGGTLIDGCAYEAERGRPYGLWIDALERLSPALVGGQKASGLAPLLGGTMPEGSTRGHLFDAVVELVEGQARAKSALLLTLDDVQWLDEASVDLLHYVVRTCRGLPVVVALAARAGELADNRPLLRALRSLRRERLVEEVELARLGPEEIERLVKLVRPKSDVEEAFRASGGNPLFALEVARAGRAQSEGDVPAALGQVVRDRLERLPPEALDVLRWASVLGTTFRVSVLGELVGLDTGELVNALEILERHSLIGGLVDLQDPGGSYQFAHELVHRVVYADVSIPRQRLMHLGVARALDRARAGDEALAADVAHHAILAGDAQLGAAACAAAARWSLRLFAPAQAVASARRGMRLAEQLAGPERSERLAELHAVLAEAEAR